MSRVDRLALLLAVLITAVTAYISLRVYEAVPHFEDEMAYVWQARVITRGQITVPSPQPNPRSFLVPFVVDYHGQRFGKYPIGWPVVLSFAEPVGARGLVNPLLAGANAWLLYLLGKKLFDARAALIAAGLLATSPFYLLNSASLLSHPWSLFLALAFIIGWFDAFTAPNPALPAHLARWLPAAVSALAIGTLALTRPWTAAGIALPFALHGLWMLLRGSRAVRLRLVGFVALAGAVSLLYLAWQAAVTGDPLLNPYTLWWHYDKVGFGPGHGRHAGGYQPAYVPANLIQTLYAANVDLFGWPLLSWLFLPFGLWAARRNGRAWLVTAVALSLTAAYALYWTPSWFYGPRYLFEGLAAPFLLTAAGIYWLGGGAFGKKTAQRSTSWTAAARVRFALVALVVGLLVGANLRYFLPQRVESMRELFGMSADCLTPLQRPDIQQAAPAIVFVHVQRHFFEYACVSVLNSPFLDTPVIYAISRGELVDSIVARANRGRAILHYYPDTRRVTILPREIPQ